MSNKSNEPKENGLPEYEAFLSLQDIIDIENYEQQSREVTYFVDPKTKSQATRVISNRADIDIAVYGLRLCLKKLNGVEIDEKNIDAELLAIGQDAIIKLYAEIRLDAIKKK